MSEAAPASKAGDGVLAGLNPVKQQVHQAVNALIRLLVSRRTGHVVTVSNIYWTNEQVS